ncbi:MAG: ankyrin repeat domain-containing protein [Bacteroidota bacterium]
MRLKTFITSIIVILYSVGCSDKNDTSEQQVIQQKTNKIQSLQNPDEIYNSALSGNIDKVKKNIGDGYDVNQPNKDSQTLLMLAGFNGHTELCEYLISVGAHVDARDVNGRTALMFASTGPFPETVKLLLKNDADPNSVDHIEHFTPLMHAAAEGQFEVVKILLDNNADPSLKDIDGDTAESFARQNGHIEVAKLLIEHK